MKTPSPGPQVYYNIMIYSFNEHKKHPKISYSYIVFPQVLCVRSTENNINALGVSLTNMLRRRKIIIHPWLPVVGDITLDFGGVHRVIQSPFCPFILYILIFGVFKYITI